MIPCSLTVAGLDPSGGAGIVADLKTFHQFGVYGASVLTLVTVQSTRGVRRVSVLDPSLVEEQLDEVATDLSFRAGKTGALGSREMVGVVARGIARHGLRMVVDPVMISKHGAPLLPDDAIAEIRDALLPVTYLLTPNAHEAARLVGYEVRTLPDAERAARDLLAMGPHSVLVKGGHLEGDATDVLAYEGGIVHLRAPRIDTVHTHGTGCTYSAAVAAELARGTELLEAIRIAKAWLSTAIATAAGLGHGVGPLNHLAPVVRNPTT